MTANARVDVRVQVLGEVQLARTLQGRIRATSDLSPAFARIYDDYIDMQERAFDREGGYEGNPSWAPLSDRYRRWKEKRFPGRGILVLRGLLRDALSGGEGSVRIIERLRMIAGGSVRVGRWDLGSLHQEGTRHMPARQPLLLSRGRRTTWIRRIVEHLRQEGRE